jgi:hemoglobin-like flavoprotein
MKFVDMLSSIIDNIHSPEFIYHKIAELAPMHHRLGVRAVHMPEMCRLLISVFAEALGDKFTSYHQVVNESRLSYNNINESCLLIPT